MSNYPRVTVNGKEPDGGATSQVIIILRPGTNSIAAQIKAEGLIRELTGCKPATWTDGTGTTTITTSVMPVDAQPVQPL
jgi:hypothetical protein